jgi:hypothetical protein
MISYIRHDEEFYGIVKLITGEDVVGKMIATEDTDTQNKTLIYVQDPVEARIHNLKEDHREKKIVKGISFTKWMALSDEDFFIIPEEYVVSVGSLSQEITYYYKNWLNEQDPNYSAETTEVEMTKEMGRISTLKEAKNRLERIFKYL